MVLDYLIHPSIHTSLISSHLISATDNSTHLSRPATLRPSSPSLHFHVNHHISSASHLCICFSPDLPSVSSSARYLVHTPKVTIRVLSYLVPPRPLSHSTSAPPFSSYSSVISRLHMNGRIRPPSIACAAPMQLGVAWTFIGNGPLYITRQHRAPSTVALDISLCLSAPGRVPAVYRSTLPPCLPAGWARVLFSPRVLLSSTSRGVSAFDPTVTPKILTLPWPQQDPKDNQSLTRASTTPLPAVLRTSQAEDAGKTANEDPHN